jgi:hypothetical protein
MRINKYLYMFVVQCYYASQYGYEDVTEADNYKEGKQYLKDYRINEPEYSHRMIKRRVLNPEYKA